MLEVGCGSEYLTLEGSCIKCPPDGGLQGGDTPPRTGEDRRGQARTGEGRPSEGRWGGGGARAKFPTIMVFWAKMCDILVDFAKF